MRPQRTKLSAAEGMDMDAKALIVSVTVMDAIAELAKKPFGWNAEHALPVRQDVVEEIRDRLFGPYGIDCRGLPEPTLYLQDDGTIFIVFRQDPRTLTVEVLCAGIIHCFAEHRLGEEFFCRDKLVKLPRTRPATGYAVEVDEWGDWLLGVDTIG